jgi:hypothetical protein
MSEDVDEVGSKGMMGANYYCLAAWVCLKVFHPVAEDRSCSLKGHDIRAW